MKAMDAEGTQSVAHERKKQVPSLLYSDKTIYYDSFIEASSKHAHHCYFSSYSSSQSTSVATPLRKREPANPI